MNNLNIDHSNKTIAPLALIYRPSLRPSLFLVALMCWALLSGARAVSPPPDGGYPNFNTAEGDNALFSLTSGNNNTALGSLSLANDTSGSGNTATGSGALANNNASNNTATGFQTLLSNTSGSNNTAAGLNALFSNTSGNNNTATGVNALASNTTGGSNTANGENALLSNTTGNFNTATGLNALANNTVAIANTANGYDALQNDTTGNNNTATGTIALASNSTGGNNTANGFQALASNTTGNNNTATGLNTLFNNTTGSSNASNGFGALFNNTTGGNNTAVGYNAGSNLTKGSNNIDIGANVLGVAGEANTIRIGKQGTQKQTLIAGISGVAVTGSQVVVNSMGKLGVAASSARFKEAIKPMDNVSEGILALKPVTFRYKEEIDPGKIPQFGLIAEEVEKVDPRLVGRDEDGKVNTVRYEAVNAMLLNEFLKEHRKVQEQDADIKELKSIAARENAMIVKQQRQIDAFAARSSKGEHPV